MSDRPTAEVTTAGGHKVVHNTYITVAEKRAITEIYLEAGDTKRVIPEGEKRPMFRAEEKTIELVLVSLDDSNENILQRILDLPAEEGEEIIDLVKAAIDPKKK